MLNAIINVPEPRNEPIKSYAPGTPERDELKKQIEVQRNGQFEIPVHRRRGGHQRQLR